MAPPRRNGSRVYPRIRLSPAGGRAMQIEASRYGFHLSPLHLRLLEGGELGLSMGEALALLQGYTAALEVEIRAARKAGDTRSVMTGIRCGAIEYDRADPDEAWQGWAETLDKGGGDCEDLAAAVAAELRVDGIPEGASRGTVVRARPVVYRVRPGLLHVVVDSPWGIIDPSRLAGMGAP